MTNGVLHFSFLDEFVDKHIYPLSDSREIEEKSQ